MTLPESEFKFDVFNPDMGKPLQVASFCPVVKTTHIETGESITIDTERSAAENRTKGMEILTKLIKNKYMFCKDHGYVTEFYWDEDDLAYICGEDGCSRGLC